MSLRLPKMLRDIMSGETGVARRQGLHADEDGMLSFVNLLAVILFLMLLALVGNVGRTVNEKIEVQNSADAVAYSSATWMARGMNSVTAVNHLIGELMSFVVLYDAIGVRETTKEKQQQVLQVEVAALRAAAGGAKNAATKTPAFESIDGRKGFDVHVADTVRDGKKNLIETWTTLYGIKTLVIPLEKGPIPIRVIGVAIDILCLVVEIYAWAEWEILDLLEQMARPLWEARNLFLEHVLPKLCQSYADVICGMVPEVAGQAAEEIGRRNHCTGFVFPKRPKLPLGPDPYRFEAGAEFGKSQVVRATYPWVVYRRRPILSVMSWMKLSDAANLYLKYTTQHSIDTCRTYYDKGKQYMLVIDDSMNPGESKTVGKGNESWTRDTAAADRLFSVVGFAHRVPPRPFASGVYRQPTPDGFVAYAQAIVWNANLQDPANTPKQHQPQVGWDTLNWSRPTDVSHSYEHPEDPGMWKDRHDWAPMIRVNWQARLVPVGAERLKEAASRVPSPMDRVMRRHGDLLPSFRTH